MIDGAVAHQHVGLAGIAPEIAEAGNRPLQADRTRRPLQSRFQSLVKSLLSRGLTLHQEIKDAIRTEVDLEIESTHTIDIDSFVPRSEISGRRSSLASQLSALLLQLYVLPAALRAGVEAEEEVEAAVEADHHPRPSVVLGAEHVVAVALV